MGDAHHSERLSFGLPYEWVGIDRCDQLFLEAVARERAPIELAIELGTHMGMTSFLLAMILRFMDGKVVTIDEHDGRPNVMLRHWPSNAQFWPCNLLAPLVNARVASLISRAPQATLLIADNGNKLEEARRYAYLLPSGATFMAHDYGTEAPAEEMEAILADGFDAYMHELAERMGSTFRAWVRR